MADTGFLVADKCATNAVEAAYAFAGTFPQLIGDPPYMCTASSITTTGNPFDVQVLCHELLGSKDYTYVHSVILPACDPALDPNQFVQPTAAQIAFVFSWGFGAVVFFFFLGFTIGIVAKVIGKA